jgi:NADH dehydrogenase FAD-containing subunit
LIRTASRCRASLEVAMQGCYVGKLIRNRETQRAAPPPFRYFAKGNMTVIGRGFAILDSGPVKMSGLKAWLAWAFIHLLYLPAFWNRCGFGHKLCCRTSPVSAVHNS